MSYVFLWHVVKDRDQLFGIVSAYLRTESTKFGNILV